ncbi:hypothetical protein HDU67_007390 [Dinochytrium kinnereticum]|nr:hypothetical protein HDU67_007390 [Dinochytrium kinnereticum]
MAHVVSDSAPRIVFYSKEYRKFVNDEVREHPLVKGMEVPVEKWIEVEDVWKIGAGLGRGEAPKVEVDVEVLDKSCGGMIVYTSGTTANPKGVLTTYGNIEAQVSSLLQSWEWTSHDRIQLLLPLHHVHGLINVLTCGIASGATVEMVPGKLNPNAVWRRWMEPKNDLTLFMAVPTIYSKMARHYRSTFSEEEMKLATESCQQFRLMVSGSAALPEPLAQEWQSISGHKLLERYGMTEIGMALGNPLNGPRIPGTVGIPFPGMECRLIDENGNPIPDDCEGVSGELIVKGPQVFKEFKTGDIATRLQKTLPTTPRTPYYKILGRSSVDIIKTGGHKLSALTIERELLSHPQVHDAAVLGIPDEEWGERVAAVVVVTEDTTEEVLRAFLRDRCANYEVPSVWKIVREMPRNAMGKVNKKELRKSLFGLS